MIASYKLVIFSLFADSNSCLLPMNLSLKQQ